MSTQISTGVIRNIFLGESVNNPIFQILESHKINTEHIPIIKALQGITFSDGKYKTSCAIFKSDLVIEKFSLIRLAEYTLTNVHIKTAPLGKMVIISKVEVVSVLANIIGEPVTLTDYECNLKKSADSDDEIKQNPVKIIKLEQSVDIARVKSNSNEANDCSKPEVETLKNSVEPKKSISDESTRASLETKKFTPIASLSPYLSRWIIKAKVKSKDRLRTWTNSKGQGAIFSFIVEDESGAINCTAFYQEAEYYYKHIEIGKTYYMSKCKIKDAYQSFACTNHKYELTVESKSTVEECVTPVSYNFTPIAQIATVNEETTIDVIGICLKYSEVESSVSKKSYRELYKRLVTLIDDSMCTIEVTLWEDDATNFDGSNNPVVAIQGAKVGEFASNRILSAIIGSKVETNPNITESLHLKKWFDTEYQKIDLKPKPVNVTDSRWVMLKNIQDCILTKRNRGGLYYCIARVFMILRKDAVYKGCPVDYCMKKVEQLEDNKYKCERCQRKFKDYKYRLVLTVNIGDFTGNEWVTVFSKEAEKLLGKSAQEVAESMEKDPAAAGNIFTSVSFKQFVFTCRIKVRDYKDDKSKIIIDNVEDIDYIKHSKVVREMMRRRSVF